MHLQGSRNRGASGPPNHSSGGASPPPPHLVQRHKHIFLFGAAKSTLSCTCTSLT